MDGAESNLKSGLLRVFSAVSGDDHEAEADWSAGAVSLFPWRRGSHLGAGLLSL